jgi:hypothetical protein
VVRGVDELGARFVCRDVVVAVSVLQQLPLPVCVCDRAALLLLRDDIALCWLRCAASPLRRVAASPSSCAAVCCVDVVVLRVSLPPLLTVSVAGTASSVLGYSTPPHRQQQCVWSVCCCST